MCYVPKCIRTPVPPHISTKSQDDSRHYCISLAIKGKTGHEDTVIMTYEK